MSSSKPLPPWLNQVCALMAAQFRERITVTELAQAAGVHPVYLARVFRTYFDCSINDYLLALRLKYALRLLENHELSLTAIALESGFCDQGHFSKNFKRVYGISPGEYRKAKFGA